MSNPAKFVTGEQAVEELRIRATTAARDLTRAEIQFERQRKEGHSVRQKIRPLQLKRLEARLATICACIEVLTVGGNYYVESYEARNRANADMKAAGEFREASV